MSIFVILNLTFGIIGILRKKLGYPKAVGIVLRAAFKNGQDI